MDQTVEETAITFLYLLHWVKNTFEDETSFTKRSASKIFDRSAGIWFLVHHDSLSDFRL